MFGEYDEERESVSYWPSATDLFMTLFIISIAAIAAVMVALLPTSDFSDQEAVNNAVGTDMAKIRKPVGELRSTLGLPPISATAKPSTVITKLGETCDEAIQRIETLSSNDLAARIHKLQNELALAKAKNEKLSSENSALKKQLAEVSEYSDMIASLRDKIEDLNEVKIKHEELINSLITQLNDKPPIITMTGDSSNTDDPDAPPAINFSSGKATLQESYVSDLEGKLFPKVGEILEKYTTVDTLEIVGHTDGAPVSSKSNLDESIAAHFAGSDNFSTMTAGSNCDLGLMRALAIRKAWKDWLRKEGKSELNDRIQVRCYSAAQTVPPEGSKAARNGSLKANWLSPNQDARRIEIRFTQLKEAGN